jgi:hypothetical protein
LAAEIVFEGTLEKPADLAGLARGARIALALWRWAISASISESRLFEFMLCSINEPIPCQALAVVS